jgi:hypothetical protein
MAFYFLLDNFVVYLLLSLLTFLFCFYYSTGVRSKEERATVVWEMGKTMSNMSTQSDKKENIARGYFTFITSKFDLR